MHRIELELSDAVFARWKSFLGGEAAGRLTEARLLGDWAVLALLANLDRYLKDGGPPARPEPTREEAAEADAASARKKLTKQQKRVLPMFNENDRVTLEEISRVLGLMPADGQILLTGWLAEGFLASGPLEERGQTYILSPVWLKRNLAANRPSLNVPRTLEDLADKKRWS